MTDGRSGAAPPVATEAILLVGGLGTRLRPLTVHTPKPMLPVAGVPFVVHQLARLRDAGVRHVVLATSYRAEVFPAGLRDVLGLEIDYVTEETPLGTGGAIRNASSYVRSSADDPVVVMNGDVLSAHDVAAEVAFHVAAQADVTLFLTKVVDARAFGCVPTDDAGRVTAFLEKMPEPVTDQVNAGCYVFRRSVIDAIPAGQVVSVERDTFPALVASGAVVVGYLEAGYWLDLGTPAALVTASRDLVLGRLASSVLPGPVGSSLLLADAVVDAGAEVSGGSVVGAGARVARGAVVEGSVLLDGSCVAAGAVVRDSVVGERARVGAGALVTEAVVGDGAVVGARCVLRPGARVWVDESVPDGAVRTAADPSPP